MNRASLPQPMKITRIRTENAATKTFVLAGALSAQPGQFVMAWWPGFEDKPFSLAGANPVSLTVAAVGRFSQALHRLQVGDFIWVRGPLGQGYRLPDGPEPPGHLVLVGGGYGAAPLLFLTRQALAHGFQVSTVLGARHSQALLLVDAFAALDVPLWLTTEDGSRGQQGRVTDALTTILAEAPAPPQTIYACGPTAMLRAVAAQAEAAAIPVQLAWEAPMRCGLGLCGSCEVGQGWLTCLDGPIFPFDPVARPPYP